MSTYFSPDSNQGGFANILAQLGSAAFAEIGSAPGQVPDSGFPGYDPIAACKSNMAASTTPGTGNDKTQGYVVGSIWINTTANTVYMCTNNATGAAVWVKLSP
jgi:hypothetical protein